MISQIDGTTVTAIGSAFTAMAGAVAALWKVFHDKSKKFEETLQTSLKEQKTKTEKVEEKYIDSLGQITQLTGRVSKLEGRIEMAEEVKEGVESIGTGITELSSAVLQFIDEKRD